MNCISNNNELFTKNKILFSKRFPSLANLIWKNLTPEKILSYCDKLEVQIGKTNLPTVKENGKFWHSFYSPEKESSSLVLTSECKEKSTIVFLGYGLGYGVLEASKNHPDKTIIIVEPDISYALFPFFYTDFSKLFQHEKLILLFGAELQQVIAILENQEIENCHFIKNQNQIEHCKEYFNNLEQLIKRNKQKKQINDNTYKKFGKLWIKNTCKNFKQNCNYTGINIFKDIAKGKNACIIAAGPTLSEILPQLKEIQKKCILICVDTALKTVLKFGIIPEFTVMVDPQYWNTRHLDFTDTSSTILITENAVYPRVFEYTWKDIYFCSALYPLGKLLEKNIKRDSLGAGGSVATTAWDFARFLGCTNIFMAGLDLGYPKNQTHIKGSTFEHLANIKSNYLLNTETQSVNSLFSANPILKKDYEENPIQTDSRMTLYAWWFESKCAEFLETKTYSLSKKSLAIPGIQYFSIEELLKLNDQEKIDFFNFGKNTKNKDNFEKQSYIKNLQILKKQINESYLKIQKDEEILPEIENLIFPFLSENNTNEKINALKKLSKILEKIEI